MSTNTPRTDALRNTPMTRAGCERLKAKIICADECTDAHGFSRKGAQPGDELSSNIRQMGDTVRKLRARVADLESQGAAQAFVDMSVRASEAEQRVKELEADKERLDWLEASPYRHVEGDYWDTGNPYWRSQDRKNVNTIACIGPDIRAAIDVAREAQP